MRLPDKPAWRDFNDTMLGGELNLDLPLDELEIASDEEDYERYDPERSLPASLAEVKAVKSMRFEPELEMEAPSDLYAHTDDSTTTRLVPEYSSLFAHSASSSFFAYLPVYFWKQVVQESNRYAAAKEIRIITPFSMEELMTFLGIMFYMTLTDKGEYSNYWGSQTEDAVFGGASTSLDTVLCLRRFKLIRRCLSFRSEPGMSVERDPAARIRPLLNLLKCTGGRYVEVGRDLALGEASIACRSRHGRHLIVYNPQKPGGKYHFRMYVSTRGDYQQSVASEHNVFAASWCDGSIVTMATNADPSTTTTVTRRIGASNYQSPVPTCILNYNQHMQGVDRLDQIRARFSLADGHSYKQWHKNLALALIDIARANAYLTRRIAIDTSRDRDPHRTFLTELVSELISGRWKDAPRDGRMVFGCSVDREIDTTVMATQPSIDYPVTNVHNPQMQCEVMSSKQLYKDKGRRKRECVICRYEGRYPTEVTDHCLTHSVGLAELCMVMPTLHTLVHRTLGCARISSIGSISLKDFSRTEEIYEGRQPWLRSRQSINPILSLLHDCLRKVPHASKVHQISNIQLANNIPQGSEARPVSKAHHGSEVLRDCNVHHVNKARQSNKTRSCGKVLIDRGKHDLHTQQILPDLKTVRR
ncbi:unnamed protein product [Phytophthora fragariaefolia]|uniref:Unnamed protein product n=1 Tax=Phytophthora fragariaefolia TaxID=1490495 RepID=A0A9W6XS73_9STRA|nr:unnamed protein product [Phytophthora fragariaefolia]